MSRLLGSSFANVYCVDYVRYDERLPNCPLVVVQREV